MLMLRIHAAALAAAQLCLLWPRDAWAIVPLTPVILALLAGLFTRSAAALVTATSVGLAAALTGATGLMLAIGALAGAALVLLGAGAWSLDARLFGRRIILFRPAR